MGDKLNIYRGFNGEQVITIVYECTEQPPAVFGPNSEPPPHTKNIGSDELQVYTFSSEQPRSYEQIRLFVNLGDFTVFQVNFSLSKAGKITLISTDKDHRDNPEAVVDYHDDMLDIRLPPDVKKPS